MAPPAKRSTTAERSAEKLFAAAMANFQSGERGQAVLEFTALVQRYPRHPLAAKAQWWVGEAYYRQRDYRQALAEFQRLIDLYPQSREAPEALVQIGLCHRALEDARGARTAWEQVERDHPRTEAAARARTLLAGRDGSSRRSR
jgi:tol-pal system protein YbgF